jgi:hypothetical protein
MPTPVGHALGGLAIGWLIAGSGGPAQPLAATRDASIVTGVRQQLRTHWRRAALFATLGALPDIDLLFHVHSTYTHSLGAALLAGLVAWPLAAAGRQRLAHAARAEPAASSPASAAMTTRSRLPAFMGPAIMALACAAAYASHVLLDWLGTDTSPPYGITALWPFSSAYYYSALDLFPAADRRYWLPGFWQRDLMAIGWELLVLLPITLAVLWLRAPARTARSNNSPQA